MLKLLGVIAVSTAACISLYGLAAAILLLMAASIAARIPPWELLRGAKPLIVMAFGIALLNYQTPAAGIMVAMRICIPFAAAALLFSVTTMRELRLSLGRLETRLRNFCSAGRGKERSYAYASLGLSLMLGFIPRFFELWEAANLACDARLHRRGIRRLIILVPLVTERMMEAAADTALALEARGVGW